MGDAKRAPFEQRKAVAIAKQKIKAEQRAVRIREIEANKSPDQRAEKRRAWLSLFAMAWPIYPRFPRFRK